VGIAFNSSRGKDRQGRVGADRVAAPRFDRQPGHVRQSEPKWKRFGIFRHVRMPAAWQEEAVVCRRPPGVSRFLAHPVQAAS
jgi:hypothetical protein